MATLMNAVRRSPSVTTQRRAGVAPGRHRSPFHGIGAEMLQGAADVRGFLEGRLHGAQGIRTRLAGPASHLEG